MHPESVARDAERDVFYAATVGEELATTAKDGDGSIARLAPDGTVETLRFLPASDDATLHAPKGTVVLGGRLYTADIDRVVGFSLDERAKVTEVSLRDKDVSFLNDVAVVDDQTLVVSAPRQGRIYRVDLDEKSATALDVDVPGANGLTYAASEDVLYAVTFGGEQGDSSGPSSSARTARCGTRPPEPSWSRDASMELSVARTIGSSFPDGAWTAIPRRPRPSTGSQTGARGRSRP
jgi:hypothetical protein